MGDECEHVIRVCGDECEHVIRVCGDECELVCTGKTIINI